MHLKNSSYCKTRGNAFQCDQRISFIVNCFRLCSLFYFSDEEDWISSNSHHSYSENCKDVFGNLSSQTSVSIREIKPDLIPWRTTHIILLLSVPFHKEANSSVREKYKKKISRSQNHCVILPFSRQTNVTLKVRKEKKDTEYSILVLAFFATSYVNRQSHFPLCHSLCAFTCS